MEASAGEGLGMRLRMVRSRWRSEGGFLKSSVFVFTLFFFTLFLHPHPLSFGQENLPAIIKRVQPSIVSILIINREGKVSGQGSGFFVNREGDIITSRHVLEGAGRSNVITSEGKELPIKKVVAEDPDGDLIQVSVALEGERVQPLSISPTLPETGERVIVIGTPLGLEKTVSDGIVSAVRDVPGFGKIIQVTAPISPGSSGSPVVNMKGEVVGVATFFVIAGQNLNFAIPVERISKLIRGEGPTLSEREEQRTETLRASEEYLYHTGLRYLWVEDYEKALSLFLEVIKRNPHHGDAHFQIGYCLGRLGKYREAIEPYQQALRIKPNDADTQNNLCVAYGMIGRYPEAIASCQQALQVAPNFAEPYNNRAWSLHQLGRYQEAIESSKQAIRLKPDFVLAHYNLGNAYMALKQYKEAMESYKQAIRIKFDYAEAQLNLGAAYTQMERYEEAIESYRQVLRIKPDLAEAHLNLGMTHLKLGDRGTALDEYKALRELNKEMAKRLFDLIYE
jgi:tetratricopeptide (TPR) repeat protein